MEAAVGTPARLEVAVLVFLQRGDEFLLVRQAYGQRYWSLPGGVVETGESLEQAAIREVAEETGLQIRVGRVVGLYSRPGEAALAITLEGEITGGEMQSGLSEISECAFFPLDKPPPTCATISGSAWRISALDRLLRCCALSSPRSLVGCASNQAQPGRFVERACNSLQRSMQSCACRGG